MNIEKLIRAEAQFKQTLLATRGSVDERRRFALEQAPKIAWPEVPSEVNSLPPEMAIAPISTATYHQVYKESHSRSLPTQWVTQVHIDEARSYVQELFDVDLSKVQVEVLPNSQWNDDWAEASHFKSGIDNHLILIPEMCPCSPDELLVHEFGHAGHVTAQRQTGEYPFFFAQPMTVEFPAHFCQYNFILDKLSRIDFMKAMLQVVTSTYALAVLNFGSMQNFEAFWVSEEADAIRQAWPQSVLIKTFRSFQDDRQYFLSECRRGVSQMLALTLVDRHEEMRKFIRLDRYDRAIAPKLEEAFPGDQVTEGFRHINEQVVKLLSRFSV